MKKFMLLLLCLLLPMSALCGCGNTSKLDPDNPVTLSIWHVYGSQTESPLNDAINEFNQTTGKELGVIVNVISVMDSDSIDDTLIASANNVPGSVPLPDLFTAYPRVAEKIGYEKLLNWNEYFTEEELDAYVSDFLVEGTLNEQLLVFPIAKSSELFFLNQTLFDRFCEETGVTMESLSTFEGIFESCQIYYDWTGGTDMFQLNDFYHYFLTTMQGLGGEFVTDATLNTDSELFEKTFTPMAKAAIYGGLCLGNGFASDRWKTAEIIGCIGSTASILYLRDYVTYPDNSTEDITTTALAYPTFNTTSDAVTISRGVGLYAVKSEDERKNEAASVFAKWISQPEHNLNFVTKSGYLPVTNEAFDSLFADMSILENEKYTALYEGIGNMVDSYSFTSAPLFDNSMEIKSDFETIVKSILSSAHESYLSRVENGEDKDTVMNELLHEALLNIQSSTK